MFYPNFILFTCVNYIIFTRGFSVVQSQELHSNTQHPSETSKISEKNLDYEQRGEGMIDPHDMFPGLSIEQLKELLKVEKPVIDTSTNPSASNKPTVNNKEDATAHTENSKAEPPTIPVSSNGETLYMPKEQKGYCALDSIYVARWVKKLLHRIEKESDMESSTISFSLDSTIMESLKKMMNAKLFEVSAFDNIISNLLAQAIITRRESLAWSHIFVLYPDTLRLPVDLTMTFIVFIFLMAIIKCNYIFITSWLGRIHPKPAISRSQVKEVSTLRQILTEAVCNAAFTIQNESVEAILAEDSTGLSKTQSPAKAIQYNSSDDATKLLQRTSSKIVDVLGKKSLQSGYSDPVVDVNVKKILKKSTLATETSPKRLSIGDNSKVDTLYNADSMDTTRDASSFNPIHSHSNNSEINLDKIDEVEVSNLPESLSDSFEVLYTDDDINESRYCNISHAGSNCDTSLDILQEMHASCKFCK